MPELGKSTLMRHRLAAGRASPLRTYRELTTGGAGWGRFIYYELVTMLFGPMPGGLGFWLRKRFYRRLFRQCGRGLILGRNVVIRHPQRIVLGDNVTIDDNCVLDGRGDDEAGIVAGDEVIINRNCMLQAKGGRIELGARTNLGSNCVVVSTAGVRIGEAALFAGGCYVSAGAYRVEGTGAVMDQPAYSAGPISIGAGCWIGTCAVVLDAVSVGAGAVIGAGAVVHRDVPPAAIAAGVPARVLRMRGTGGADGGD